MGISTRLTGLIFAMMLGVFSTNSFAQKAPADPARLKAAQALVAASGGAEQARDGMVKMRDAMLTQIKRSNPRAAAEVGGFLRDYLSMKNPKTKAYIDGIVEHIIAYYAANFTVEELHLVTQFQKTKAGQKFQRLAPAMMASMAPKILAFQQTMIGDIQAYAKEKHAKQNKK